MNTKTTWLRAGLAIAILLPILAAAAFLDYYLSSTDVVRISGIDTIRVNAQGNTRPSEGPTHDLRLIYAERVSDGATRVFRNEDTGWGWPPYFKFNSGDLTGQASNLAQQQPRGDNETDTRPAVLVTYYGWRLHMLSMYPNLVSMRVVDPDYVHIPVFNIVFLTLLFLGIGWVVFQVRRWWRNRVAARANLG